MSLICIRLCYIQLKCQFFNNFINHDIIILIIVIPPSCLNSRSAVACWDVNKDNNRERDNKKIRIYVHVMNTMHVLTRLLTICRKSISRISSGTKVGGSSHSSSDYKTCLTAGDSP